ncbi:MAG: methionine--tRNA ligase [Candidatus Jacksonbacteria bacterium RIFCSPHIGHO2_12_FULL_44_12]|nr:MAG: methionine--tRNA ligase [Candidatus Jacksonbacteria bacterium RIFCSPHIGHO2_12_FULL_44_12]
MSKFYLTTPIYYVNAMPHIGHAYTTLAADAIARYYREKIGEDRVFFLTGTDEHGAKIAEAAERDGKNPKLFCDEIATLFVSTWQRLNISHNHFIRTTDEYHEQGAAEFLRALKVKGALYEGDYAGLYCNGCESFITEKQLREDGLCKDHLRKPERIVEKNWFFKLDKYLPKIQTIIEQGAISVLPEARTEEVLGLFRQGMENFSVSRPNVRWGIPLPWDNAQTMYVWVEALLNYWTAVHKRQMFWPPDLQIIGKDIIKFHCIYWPAMLLAYYDGDAEKIPKTIFAHGFFTVNGQKMSKTLGNVIDPNDLCDRYGRDGARYLILSQFPFGSDGDIEEGKFDEKYNADLANGIGNLVSRVTTLCVKQITDWQKFWKLEEEQEIKGEKQDAKELINNFMLYEMIQSVIQDARLCDEILAKEKPWQYDKQKEQEKITADLAYLISRILSIAKDIAPFLPLTTKTIQKKIDISKKIIEPVTLFPRK